MISMTQQALYDTNTAQVLQWQDTQRFSYASPPSTAKTITVTPAEWANQSGEWWVVNGALTQTNPFAPTTVQLLAQAQSAKIASGLQSYQSAVTANISFTNAAGVTDIYQADPDSIQKLHEVLSGYRSTGTVPTGFYWRSATNQNNTFTFADLDNLALALTNRGWAAFQHLQNFKAQVMACTTITCVQGVTW